MLNRRHFFFGSMAAPLVSRAQSAAAPIRAGFIGVGNRGGYMLQPALKQAGVKVVALCDIKPDRLDKAATSAARDNPATYRDYRELLQRQDIDAVHISTPCDLHVEMAIAALKAGKHVYCEKPAGINPASIGELIKAVRASSKVFLIGQQMRSSTRLRDTIARISDGLIGKVVMVKAQRHTNDDLDHDGPSADWFFDASRSGDVIVEMSVHNLDMFNWVIGGHPLRAAGFGGTLVYKNLPPGRTNMDGYTLSYDYPGEVILSYTQVFFHTRGMPGNGQYCHVHGTEGSVDLDNAMFYPRSKDAKPQELVEPRKEDLNLLHVTAFYDAIRNGTKVPAGIVEGATGALTAILGREAIYKKRVMEWSQLGPVTAILESTSP